MDQWDRFRPKTRSGRTVPEWWLKKVITFDPTIGLWCFPFSIHYIATQTIESLDIKNLVYATKLAVLLFSLLFLDFVPFFWILWLFPLYFMDSYFCFLVTVGFMTYLRFCKPPNETYIINFTFWENKPWILRFTFTTPFAYQIFLLCVCYCL
jgi:hypothetical protein